MSAALAHGDVVAKRYRLIAPLGQGGMGVVWRAEHLVLGRPVAVKFGTRGGSQDARRAQRFLSEAKTAATVRHPNVVDILDFGVSELGQPYMVMELLEGLNLRERFSARPPLSVGHLLDHVDAVLAGLAAVHGAGLVHRDLKPENVFLAETPNGVVPKLLDFGLTRPTHGDGPAHDAVTVTQEDQIVGTPAFMAPEQVRQLEDLDGRTDVWGIGVLLYSALTGTLPFDAPKMVDLLFEITRGEDPKPVVAVRPEIGTALSDVVARALARDRAERHASVDVLRSALRDARGVSADVLDKPVRALPASTQAQPDAWTVGDSTRPPPPTPEILTLPGDSRDESSIRERPPSRRRGWRHAAAIALILAVGVTMSAWLMMHFFGSGGAPGGDSASAPEAAVPAAGSSEATPAAEPERPRSLTGRKRVARPPERPRKAAPAKPRAPGPDEAPALFREPDY